MGSQEKSFKLHIYDIDEKWSFSYKSCFFYHSYILSLQNNTPEYSTIETNDSLNGGQVLVNFRRNISNNQENSHSDSKHNLYDGEEGVYNSLFEKQEKLQSIVQSHVWIWFCLQWLSFPWRMHERNGKCWIFMYRNWEGLNQLSLNYHFSSASIFLNLIII